MVPTISLLSALTLVVSVGAASAENTFALDRDRSTPANVVLTNVLTEKPSTVEVYAYDEDGEVARFLGWAQINAGSHDDVAVLLNEPSTAPLQILLSNGNHAVSVLRVREPLTIPEQLTD